MELFHNQAKDVDIIITTALIRAFYILHIKPRALLTHSW